MKCVVVSATAAAVFPLFSSVIASSCPPLGAVLPPPQVPSQNEAVKLASQKLKSTIDSSFSSKLNSSGISIMVKSIHEDRPLFSYHFTPPVLSDIGTASIDDNTIFRVGSLSKIFPALAALQSKSIHMDDSMLEYIPELKNAASASAEAVPWEDVTIDSLMTHLSGLATDTAFDLGIIPIPLWQAIGLPAIAQGTGPTCSGLPGTEPCTQDDLVKDLQKREPIYLPYTSPSYSNVGFALLGMVINAATNKSYIDNIQENVFDVVGMNSSSFNGFVKSFPENGFVPVGETTWNVTLGVFEGAGGMFSSTSDLIAFAEGILNNRFLSPRRTREWMKPRSHTTSWGYSVGAPWEILRSDHLTADGRIVDLYTKSGDLGLYHSVFGLIPDFDISVVLLIAGAEVSENMPSEIFSAIVEELIPTVDEAGRAEAISMEVLNGTYTDHSTNSTIMLTIDTENNLAMEKFIVRGFDVLHNPDLYSLDGLSANLSSITEASYVNARLYPTNLVAQSSNGNTQRSWRAIYDTTTAAESLAEDAKLVWKNGSCQSWLELDRAAYDFKSIGDFIFSYGKGGNLAKISAVAFNVTLTRAA
ncbi:beta-lactamase/transpeptidase-like protein [Trichoderma sp. SZMC 28014]